MEPQNSQKAQQKSNQKQLQCKYQACMVLAAVGDAMGYKNGDWEFCTSGKVLHQKLKTFTNGKGIESLHINLEWKYSDDTVMHIGTAEALLNKKQDLSKIQQIAKQMAVQYKITGDKMAGRAPGKTCMKAIHRLEKDGSNWNKTPFSERGGGCGGSMRAACIGLVYCTQQSVPMLVKVSIESARITHHNPVGYLGSMVAAYFTNLALRRIKPSEWVAYLLQEAIPISEDYIKSSGREVQLNLQKNNSWANFIKVWKKYAEKRQLPIQKKDNSNLKQPKFPEAYGVSERQQFYHEISISSWPGSTGQDSVIIAYDAFLGSKGDWIKFCERGVIHGGDNDSTGTIGGAWFGAYYGFKSVPQINYKDVEDNKKLRYLGKKLFNCRWQQKTS